MYTSLIPCGQHSTWNGEAVSDPIQASCMIVDDLATAFGRLDLTPADPDENKVSNNCEDNNDASVEHIQQEHQILTTTIRIRLFKKPKDWWHVREILYDWVQSEPVDLEDVRRRLDMKTACLVSN